MDDIRFNHAQFMTKPWERIRAAIKHDEIRPIADAFVRNMSRLTVLTEAIPHVAEACLRVQMRADVARFNVLRNLDPIDENHPRSDELRAEIERLKTFPSQLQERFRPLTVGHDLVASFLAEADPIVELGLKAMLAAQVISAWTVYETLMKDLWIACVNARPRTLGFYALGLDPTEASTAPRDRMDSGGKLSKKSLTFAELAGFGFDVSARLGTLLSQSGEFNFKGLDGIQSAYKRIFGAVLAERQKNAALAIGEKIAGDMQNLDQKSLITLQAIRNVLVHNGGIADRQFIERMKGIEQFPSLHPIEEGREINVSGDLSVSLAQRASNECILMLRIADYSLGTLSQ